MSTSICVFACISVICFTIFICIFCDQFFSDKKTISKLEKDLDAMRSNRNSYSDKYHEIEIRWTESTRENHTLKAELETAKKEIDRLKGKLK